MKFLVQIVPKFKDKNLVKYINNLSNENFEDFSLRKIYLFKGEISKEKIIFITKVLLLDPIIEKYKIEENIRKNNSYSIINIWYKPEVLDVVSLYVTKGIKYLGIKEKIDIYTGTQFYIKPRFENNRIKKFIEKFFVNTLIHNYEII